MKNRNMDTTADFHLDARLPTPVRYRFVLTRTVSSTHDLLVENGKVQMEPARMASPHMTFHLVKHDQTQWELWTHFRETLDVAESDFADYLHNLEAYEESLARGDMKW
jgi:hypothetical protein